MRLLAWNVNHRAARRKIPEWVVAAIAPYEPEVVVLTEYVQGPDHARFLTKLDALELTHSQLTPVTKGQNQVLIASRKRLSLGNHSAPAIHPAVPPNALHVVVDDSDFHVIAIRVPAFTGSERHRLKRLTWEWLLQTASDLRDRHCVIAGDLNTALTDDAADCGDCARLLLDTGWRDAIPAGGYSWRHAATSGITRRIDHAFVSPVLVPLHAEYSWQFHGLAPEAGSCKAGIPDHAMLVVDLE